MLQRVVIAVALIALLSGCAFEVVVGSGEAETRPHTFEEELHGVVARGSFEVHVTVGDEQAVAVTADGNLHDDLEVEVRGGVLHLGLRSGIQVRNATLQAQVQLPDVEVLQTSGSARVLLEGPASSAELEVSSSGASEVQATQLDVEELDVQTSGSASVELQGAANRAELSGSGASSLDLGEMAIEDLQARLSGAASAEVELRGDGRATLSGSSRLTAHGPGRFVDRSVSGSARLEEP